MQLIRDDIDLSDYMNEGAVTHKVNPASDWTQGVIDHFYKSQERPMLRLPWLCTQANFRVRAGEVTLWAGINGHGKSMISGQAAIAFCEQGERVCIASLEMPPIKTMARIARQCSAYDEPPLEYIKNLGLWTDGKLWLYDHLGSCKQSVMLAVIRYAIETFGITQFFVDNLMKVIAGEDNYNEQKDFVNSLCAIAKDTGCHIHLVLHIKKLKDEESIPNKFDIKGSGAIADLVDNIFIVWRNKKKENAMREHGNIASDEPDAILIQEKQRHAEEIDTGFYPLWFDQRSMQYLESRHDMPKMMRIDIGVPIDEVEF